MSEYVRITVTLTQPVAVGRNVRADSRQDTHNHVPGSVLRGALAAAWIHRRGREVTRSSEFLETSRERAASARCTPRTVFRSRCR